MIDTPEWIKTTKLVCKVDQEIKHRKLNNLVLIDANFDEC